MRWTSRSVVAALVAGIVLVLTFFGLVDSLPTPLRAGIQSIGTLAGVYLGSLLQHKDQRQQMRAVADSAIANLAALGRSLSQATVTVAESREMIGNSTSKSTAVIQAEVEGTLRGLDGHLRSVLIHAQGAAEAWKPFTPNYDVILRGTSNTEKSDDK